MDLASTIGGIVLLLAAASLAVLAKLTLVPVLFLVLLVLVGLVLLFGANDTARASAARSWSALQTCFHGKGGWPLWEAVAAGLVFFGVFAGVDFLTQALIILAAFFAPWLAGLWASRRGTPAPAVLGTVAGAIVGAIEGRFFLAWLPVDWRLFPAGLLATVIATLAGAGLGFWSCARGRLKLARVS